VAGKGKLVWYGVRTLFRVVAAGKPKSPDKYFDPNSTLLEDRVVLFQARDFDDAIRQAEKEAKDYSRTIKFVNVYGQPVRMRFLGAIDAYQIFDHPVTSGCEVYSSTTIIPRAGSDSRVVKERFGEKEKRWQARKKFADARVLAEALAMMKRQAPKLNPRQAPRPADTRTKSR